MLTRKTLIGRVAGDYLHEHINPLTGGTARFVLDRLSPEQMVAIADTILGDAVLRDRFEIRLPRPYLAHLGLPESVLTDERATFHRNEETSKAAVLLANVGDDEEQSLKDLSGVGAADLLSRSDLWVRVAASDLPITDEQRRWWMRALDALQDLRFVSLDRYANYVVRTHAHIRDDGLPLAEALGAGLPALLMPRRTHAFHELPEKMRGRVAKWKTVFNHTSGKCAPYLSKRRPDGTLLSDDDLRAAFERTKEAIPDVHHPLIEAFIAAPAGWTSFSAQLAECEWEHVKPLFDGLQREKLNLAQATLAFYDETEPENISDDERSYLDRLRERRTTEPSDDDREFYDRHRDELRQDRKLKSFWEKFVYGNPKEVTDFFAGLMLSLEAFDWDGSKTSIVSRKLRVSCDKRTKRDLLRELNADAGRYFATRYRGIKAVLGNDVEWDVGSLFEYDAVLQEGLQRKQDANLSEKKSALQIKFIVELEVTTAQNIVEHYATQFIWRFFPLWILSEFPGDLDRLVRHPFQESVADRETTSSKGLTQSVDLRDVKTLVASYGHARGTLVSKYASDRDIRTRWQANLGSARNAALVTEDNAKCLQQAWSTFADAYGNAVKAFVTSGFVAPEIETQAAAYAFLIEEVLSRAPGDRNRNLLLKPLLQLGTVPVSGGRLTAIVAPWHPLRLACMARKARRFASTVRSLLTPSPSEIADMRLFFRDKHEELAHPFSPEVTAVFQGDKPALLALTDVVGDYSLHEAPLVTQQGRDETNDNPAEGAERVRELVQRYISLQPHERNNLSVVLYNCDSARLPTAVVSKLSALSEGEDDARCQVILRHRDSKRLRHLYEQIVEGSGEFDAFVASETTRDFMARLRIGIMADQAPPPDPRDGRPEDIVFLQDVIARHAELQWFPFTADATDPLALNPAQWSRRRPINVGDMKSVVYLTCPSQTRDGWAYLAAIASFHGYEGSDRLRHLPARQLDFRDPQTARILEETHNLGAWVANHDELLDRRQLAEQGVNVIRYKQTSTTGRSLVVSSTAPLGLLRSMVRRRLHDLNLAFTEEAAERVVQQLIRDANDISGDIVLRAAKRGRNASELIGLVLSRYLVKHELGDAPLGWYFLDDYADWLGQKEQQIADLLVLSPRRAGDGSKELLVIITEAKYIDAASVATKRKESARQLTDTLRRIAGAVDSGHTRLDRDVWLSRITDLLVDGVRPGTHTWLDLPDWARAVRDGRCRLIVRGYSHVFVHGPQSEPVASGAHPLPHLEGVVALQELFGQDDLKDLVRLYAEGADPTTAREGAGGMGGVGVPWKSKPAPPRSAPVHTALESSPPTVTPEQTQINSATRAPEPEREESPTRSVRWAYTAVDAWVAAASETPAATQEDEAWVQRVAAASRVALQGFNLQGKLLGTVLTPNSVLLRFQGSAGLTVDQVLKRRTEFLTTHGLDVIGVQPEAGAIVIAIARDRRQGVALRTLWKRWAPNSDQGNQSLLIGTRERNGELLVLSPGQEHAPHTLIAGSTGSGKSVLMQNIILSIVATNTPDLARITLIDPKQGVDYFAFDGLPHLDGGGVIDNQDAALARIRQLVEEMDGRYAQLKRARVSNLSAYNRKVVAADRLPVIWLIHDEFAEWMLTEEYRTEVSAVVARLGVKARAAGIHLVFAAQRPEASVMPMQLRANLGNRLILRVDSEGTSEIALGERGAERLLGKGHLLAKLDGEHGLSFAQVPFASPDEIVDLVERLQARMTERGA
ncbi:MAG: DNA translocase FtsK [Deltaproteobacteria bacterium]|nr:DNA translocase FtsK [Deltaproteobacteria bacterium]